MWLYNIFLFFIRFDYVGMLEPAPSPQHKAEGGGGANPRIYSESYRSDNTEVWGNLGRLQSGANSNLAENTIGGLFIYRLG